MARSTEVSGAERLAEAVRQVLVAVTWAAAFVWLYRAWRAYDNRQRARRRPVLPLLLPPPAEPAYGLTHWLTVTVAGTAFRGQIESIYIESDHALIRLRDRLLEPLDPSTWQDFLDRDVDDLPSYGVS